MHEITQCPNCNSKDLFTITDSNHKFALIEEQFQTNESGLHIDTYLPFDVIACKKCGFTSLFAIPEESHEAKLEN